MKWNQPLSALSLLFTTLLLCAQGAHSQPSQAIPEKLPWTLREHYTFSAGPLRLDYAKDNAEWRIKVYQEDSELARTHPEVLLRDVSFSIELSDGRVVTNDMLGYGGETVFEREPFTDDFLGEGTNYRVQFVPYGGLLVEHNFATFRQWSFLLLTIKITNQGDAPVGISKITAANIPPGYLTGLAEDAMISMRNLTFRGPYPVFAKDGPATSLRVHDPVREFGMLFAFLPSGSSACALNSPPGSSQIQGAFECVYAPAAMLAPGASVVSDPLFVGFGLTPAVMEAQYGYLLSNACAPARVEKMPRSWVTVPDTEGLSVLRAEAGNALSSGIQHALIPGGWEGRPGTFEGGSPRYPKNMAEAARALRDAGSTPGITVDPLLSHGGGGAWTAQSADGQQWVNLNTREGRNFAASRMRKLLDMGFQFLVIEPSRIPDDVLAQFGLTRALADALAFAVANEAAAPVNGAVLPTSAARLNATRDELLEAASGIAHLRERQIGMAPITVRIDGRNPLDAETTLALRLWSGPIEFLGAPPRAMHGPLSEILGKSALRAHPQDVCRTAPLLWLSNYDATFKGSVGGSIMAFSGASAWESAILQTFGDVSPDAQLWHPVENRIAHLRDGRIPPSARLAAYGWSYNMNQPVLAGLSPLPLLGLDHVKRCTWDAATNVLAGEISTTGSGSAILHFLKPQHYTLDSVKVGGRSVRPEIEGPWISVPVSSGDTQFELAFARR